MSVWLQRKDGSTVVLSLSIYHPHKEQTIVQAQGNLQSGFSGQGTHSSAWGVLLFTSLPSPCPCFPLTGVSSLFQQPPGHCVPDSNPNKSVGVWWVFFLTGRPRTSECGFWFQVFPTFWPTLVSPTALSSPTPSPSSSYSLPTLTLAQKQRAALLGCHPLWVPWISQQECFKKAKPSFFHQREKNTQLSLLCPRENSPGLLRSSSFGSKYAPNRTW